MADFTGFYYGDEHSSTYHLIRVSKGKRYEENLFPEFKDDKKEMTGGDETLYFGTSFSQRKFPIEVAFDNLREEDFRKLKHWLAPKKIKALRFDERPYKAYWAKLEKTPTFEYVCFLEEDEDTLEKVRVYKGEAKLEFIAYDAIGYCNDDTTKMTYNGLESASGYNWQELKNYSPLLIKDDNLIEWAPASGLMNSLVGYNSFLKLASDTSYQYSANLYNPGDIPADYELWLQLPVADNGTFPIKDAQGKDIAPLVQIYLYQKKETPENLIDTFVFSCGGLTSNDRILLNTKKHSLTVYHQEKGGYSNTLRSLRYDLIKSSHWMQIPCIEDKIIMKIISAIDLGNGPQIKYGYKYY